MEVWKQWKVLMETIMTIPKFRSIWIKTKESHPDKDFGEFINSLLVQKQRNQKNNRWLC